MISKKKIQRLIIYIFAIIGIWRVSYPIATFLWRKEYGVHRPVHLPATLFQEIVDVLFTYSCFESHIACLLTGSALTWIFVLCWWVMDSELFSRK